MVMAIKAKIFESTSKGHVETQINEFLGNKGINSFEQYRIHYSSNAYLDRSSNDREHYSALIEYNEE
jgi:hypothetical protein